ncbi:MAG: pyridoxal phosphate-dependent aminotransferase [Firmicutes bacterium]|nr:pyridoxal phosphate-dependent aminotransferase [Bacillota bacterium]
MRLFKKSSKLDNVCYDIRGPVMDEAQRMEAAGERILKLNIGNPAPFGFEAPAELVGRISANLAQAHGYSESKGILSARKAIWDYSVKKGIQGVELDDIYVGNGVSELIVMAMQGLLNNGDEILVPAPDYPLWTAAINLGGGKAVHYRCDEASDWNPDMADLERKITPKTKGIVVINPNNPTGAVYPEPILQKIVELAVTHQLIVFADEIYDNILYDGMKHTSIASLSDETLFITFNGLSKSHRVAGYRAGWMVVSGNKAIAKDYIEGLNMLSSMRLCSNVPAQYAIEVALNDFESIKELTKPGGRLYGQREYAWNRINRIPGLSCVKPKGALYLFPKIDVKRFNIKDDERFILDLLVAEKVLLVQGTGFNWPEPDHFRIVFLPAVEQLADALTRMERFLVGYLQREECCGA